MNKTGPLFIRNRTILDGIVIGHTVFRYHDRQAVSLMEEFYGIVQHSAIDDPTHGSLSFLRDILGRFTAPTAVNKGLVYIYSDKIQVAFDFGHILFSGMIHAVCCHGFSFEHRITPPAIAHKAKP